jgi:O-antigen/teichoic acid export membrane protein
MSGELATEADPAARGAYVSSSRTLRIVYAASTANLVGGQVFTLLLFGLLLPRQVGLISWATAAGGIVFYIADLGIETSLVVAIKNDPINLSTVTLLIGGVRLITATVLLSAWILAAQLHLVGSVEFTVMLLVGLALVARSLQTPFSAYLQVRELQATVALVQLVPVGIRLAGLLALWLAHRVDVVPVLLIMVGGDTTALIVIGLVARSRRDTQLTGQMKLLFRQLLRSAPLITLSQALLAGQNRLDWLIVAALTSYAALANYSIANKGIELLILSGSVFGRTALPWLVEGWSARNLPRNVRWLNAGLVVAGLAVALLGVPILHFLFGHKYDGASSVIPILAALAPCLAIYQIVQFASFARGRALDAVISGGIGLGAQVVVDLLTIPSHGIMGAAYGMCAYALIALPVQLGLGLRTVIPARAALELLGGAALLPAILVAGAVIRASL